VANHAQAPIKGGGAKGARSQGPLILGAHPKIYFLTRPIKFSKKKIIVGSTYSR